MQRLADILDAPVDRPVVLETTALGAAWLAGHERRRLARTATASPPAGALDRRFEPEMPPVERGRRLGLWNAAIKRTLAA